MEVELVREHSLQPGEMLSWYRVDRILGRGGFGITYLAHDTNLDQPVAIKEYLPTTIAGRLSDRTVRPLSADDSETFIWGLKRFIAEARILAKFSHPNIVRVFAVFEANNTAYMVMEFERGCDFKQYLARPHVNTEENLKTMLALIIDGLQKVHELGFIHRDIKPANIYIRDDGSPTLLDFGSARKALGSRTQTLTSLVSVGYTPLEQYSDTSSDNQGPWTDIYSLGAVLYYSIVGRPPADSTQRGSAVVNGASDPLRLVSDIKRGEYSEPFLRAIDWALCFAVSDRPQNLSDWRAALFAPAVARSWPDPPDASDRTVVLPRGAGAGQRQELPAAVVGDFDEDDDWEFAATASPQRPAQTAAPRASKRMPIVFIGALAIGLALAGYLLLFGPLPSSDPVGAEVSDRVAGAVPTAPTDARVVESSIASAPAGPQSAAPEIARLLSSLQGAFDTTDLEAVRASSSTSPATSRLLRTLFRNFESMNVSIEESALEVTDLGFEANLTILSMTRATGVKAVPADSYRHLPLQVQRAAAGGYEIHW